MEISLKVQPSQVTVLKASRNAGVPGEPNCLMQLARIHDLRDSEANYDKHQHDLSMNIIRNHEGLGPPLRMRSELAAARKIGRLPFLQSSNIMEDVLLGRDETVNFDDFLNVPENRTSMQQPHTVVEKAYGFY